MPAISDGFGKVYQDYSSAICIYEAEKVVHLPATDFSGLIHDHHGAGDHLTAGKKFRILAHFHICGAISGQKRRVKLTVLVLNQTAICLEYRLGKALR
jgi:hypothetical protein